MKKVAFLLTLQFFILAAAHAATKECTLCVGVQMLGDQMAAGNLLSYSADFRTIGQAGDLRQ